MSSCRPINYYQVLGLRPDVTALEIKRAYRKLVKDCHPDLNHNGQSPVDKQEKTERMMRLNEAYETLRDNKRRTAYDVTIGLYRLSVSANLIKDSLDEDQARENYLRQAFNPCRKGISRVLNAYDRQLKALAQDIYDEVLLAAFESYVDDVESTLSLGSNLLTQNSHPRSLDAAVHMMRHAVAQAADGLEETRRFCQNFDYDHLTMAENLFKIAQDLSRQAARLSRNH